MPNGVGRSVLVPWTAKVIRKATSSPVESLVITLSRFSGKNPGGVCGEIFEEKPSEIAGGITT